MKKKMFPPGRLYFVENTEKINKIYLGNHLALSRTNRGIKIANSKWEVICRFDISKYMIVWEIIIKGIKQYTHILK